MYTGKVKFYNEQKGYGFIISEDGKEEYFVHATGLEDGLRIKEGDKVSFDLVDGKKGKNAVGVNKNV